jgi:hypothetical protein
VAKRFFEIGSESLVTAAENEEFLSCELTRLKNADWFLVKFKKIAKENNVEIATGT